MKLGIVTETFPPEINGVALTVAALLEGLRDWGHELVLLRPRQRQMTSPEPCVIEHLVSSLAIPRYPDLRFGVARAAAVKRMFAQEQLDGLYIATEGPLGRAALHAAQRLGVPVLTGFHTRFDRYASHYGLGLAEKSVASYLRRFHNRAQATLVPTRSLKQSLEASGYQRVALLERAVDQRRFSPAHRCAQLRNSWGVDDTQLVVLYVGRIAAEKNLELAAEAFERIRAAQPGARFVLVGDGPQRHSLQARHPDFVFCGTRTGTDLSRCYASADLFLFPSTTETFGNVVLEALASGLPVAAFDLAAAHDFVRSGENGYVTDPDDRDGFIRNAVILANLARELPDLHRNARLSVRHLHPAQVAWRLAELFAELNEAVAA